MVKCGRIVAFFLIVLLIGSLIGTTTNGITKNIKLGLDLQGGFEVLYKVTTLDGKKVDKAAASNIMSVAELMHFALVDNTGEEGIRLKDELRYIEHYIRLHKQRGRANIFLKTDGAASGFRQKVIPLVLITLVENVLQHGDLSEPGSPALIRISCTKNLLEISTQNLIGLKSGTGHRMGLANLEKRLSYAYPGAFLYSSHIENNIYKCTLKIHLNKSQIC